MLPPNEPKVKLPNYLTRITTGKMKEDIRLVGTEYMIRQLWREIKQDRRTKQIKESVCDELKISTPTLERFLSGRAPIPITALLKIIEHSNVMNKEHVLEKAYQTSSFKAGTNSPVINLPKHLTPNLGYFIGAFRDGSLPQVYNREYTVEISQKEESWLRNTILPIMKHLFKIDTIKVTQYGRQMPRIRVYSKPLYLFVKEIFEFPPGSQATWRVPELIRMSHPEIKKWYVRGFFDAEGHIAKRKKRIEISQSWIDDSALVMHDLKEILLELGIRSKIIKRKIPPHDTYPQFNIRINLNDFYKFCNLIGSSHPKKIKIMKMLAARKSLAN